MFVKIFFSVVVGQLFARFNVAQGKNKYVAAWAIGLAVGLARVVNVARFVRRDIAVYRDLFTYFKEILPRHALLLGFAYDAACVLDNAGPFGDRGGGKQAQAGFGAPNAQCVIAELIFRLTF